MTRRFKACASRAEACLSTYLFRQCCQDLRVDRGGKTPAGLIHRARIREGAAVAGAADGAEARVDEGSVHVGRSLELSLVVDTTPGAGQRQLHADQGLRGFTTSPMLARGPVSRHQPVSERPTTARRKGAVVVSMHGTRHRVSCLSQKPLTATTACQRWVSSTTTRCPARTAEPGCTRTSLTMPAWVASSGISIFIDSRITRVSPASTR